MKIKNSLTKFALIGLTGLMAFNALAVQPQKLFTDTVEAVNVVQTAVVAMDSLSNLDTTEFTKDDFIDSMVDALESSTQKYDLSNGARVAFGSIETEGDKRATQSYTWPVYKNMCNVVIANNKITGKSSTLSEDVFSGITSKLLKYNGNERKLMNQFVVNHEVGHCGFYNLAAPFKIGNPNSEELINKVFGDVNFRFLMNPEGSESKLIVSSVGDLLNEAYADASASVALVKEYSGSSEVINFLNKVSVERNLTVAMTKKVAGDGINPYDIGAASKLASQPIMVKRILASDSKEMKEIILEIANKTMLTSLSKKTDKEIDIALGSWQIKEQARAMTGTYNYQYREGNIASEAVKVAFDASSPEVVKDYLDANTLIRSEVGTEAQNLNALGVVSKYKDVLESKVSVDLSSHGSAMEAFKGEITNFKNSNGLEITKKSTLDDIVTEASGKLNISTSMLKTVKEAYKNLGLKDAENISKIKILKM